MGPKCITVKRTNLIKTYSKDFYLCYSQSGVSSTIPVYPGSAEADHTPEPIFSAQTWMLETKKKSLYLWVFNGINVGISKSAFISILKLLSLHPLGIKSSFKTPLKFLKRQNADSAVQLLLQGRACLSGCTCLPVWPVPVWLYLSVCLAVPVCLSGCTCLSVWL